MEDSALCMFGVMMSLCGVGVGGGDNLSAYLLSERLFFVVLVEIDSVTNVPK